jgi:hypothetical protein
MVKMARELAESVQNNEEVYLEKRRGDPREP